MPNSHTELMLSLSLSKNYIINIDITAYHYPSYHIILVLHCEQGFSSMTECMAYKQMEQLHNWLGKRMQV